MSKQNRAALAGPHITPAMPASLHIRPVSSALDDGLRILNFVDSQIPFLARIGSEGQWGSTALSDDIEKQERYRTMVARTENQLPWGQSWTRAFIAEVTVDQNTLPDEMQSLLTQDPTSQASATGLCFLPVAAIVLEHHAEDYVAEVLPAQDVENPFVYVRFLVTDRRTAQYGKGAATALLEHAKAIAVGLNIRRLCLDCWSGNNRKLVQYYQKHDFQLLGDVLHDGWPAAVLTCRI